MWTVIWYLLIDGKMPDLPWQILVLATIEVVLNEVLKQRAKP